MTLGAVCYQLSVFLLQPWVDASAAVPDNPLQPGYGYTSGHCASMVNNLHLITTISLCLT
jgi:hypothetical protein